MTNEADSPRTTVFVRLLDEGVNVWRPVQATDLGHRRYRLIALDDYDSSLETREFSPGAVVECERRALGKGPAMVATRLTC